MVSRYEKRIRDDVAKMSLDSWLDCIHDWYTIKIEQFDCVVCWFCGKVKLK